jgi:hypothetical protein
MRSVRVAFAQAGAADTPQNRVSVGVSVEVGRAGRACVSERERKRSA